jgi:hypothetical protein
MGDFFDPFGGQTRGQAEEILRRIEPSPPASDQPLLPSAEAPLGGPLSIVDGELLWRGEPIRSREAAPTPEPETAHASRRR